MLVAVVALAVIAVGAIAALAYSLYTGTQREREWAAERRLLLIRIQTPELAPTLAAPEPSGEKLYVAPGDDEGHAEYMEQRSAGEAV